MHCIASDSQPFVHQSSAFIQRPAAPIDCQRGRKLRARGKGANVMWESSRVKGAEETPDRRHHREHCGRRDEKVAASQCNGDSNPAASSTSKAQGTGRTVQVQYSPQNRRLSVLSRLTRPDQRRLRQNLSTVIKIFWYVRRFG